MGMSVFDCVHGEVLDTTLRDGGLSGLNKYMEHERFYDNLPGRGFMRRGGINLRKKLEVINAVESVEELSGVSFAARKDLRILSEECVDYVIESLHSGLDILDKKYYDIIPNPVLPN